MTPVEVRALLADPSGHGLFLFIDRDEHGRQYIRTGSRLKTPWRVLWHAESLGLNDQLKEGDRIETRPISLEEVLARVNAQNRMTGQKPITMSTIHNALSPLARDLMTMFGVKVLIRRKENLIKLFSESFAQTEFASMNRAAERVFERYTEILRQCENVGIDASQALGCSDSATKFALMSQKVLNGAATTAYPSNSNGGAR
jgi:hypothetical protein